MGGENDPHRIPPFEEVEPTAACGLFVPSSQRSGRSQCWHPLAHTLTQAFALLKAESTKLTVMLSRLGRTPVRTQARETARRPRRRRHCLRPRASHLSGCRRWRTAPLRSGRGSNRSDEALTQDGTVTLGAEIRTSQLTHLLTSTACRQATRCALSSAWSGYRARTWL